MSLIQLNRIRSGFWIWGVVGENVVNRDLLYLSGDETWRLTDASAAGTMPARGVAMDTANAGETIGVLLIGTIYGANWAWTPGAALYASTVAGQFTETAPVAPNVAQRVGEAYRTNLIFFDPDLTDENAAGVALIYARERPAASQGPRNVLNFIEGANITLTVADNVPNAEIDITIASAGGADNLARFGLFCLYEKRGKTPPRQGTKEHNQQRKRVSDALRAYGYQQASNELVEKAAEIHCERKGYKWVNVSYKSFAADFGVALQDAEYFLEHGHLPDDGDDQKPTSDPDAVYDRATRMTLERLGHGDH